MKIEEKLSFFRNCIIDEVDGEVNEKRKKLLKTAADELTAYEKKAKKKNLSMIEVENEVTLEVKRQMYSRARIKKSEIILKHKNNIMNDIVSELKIKLSGFVGTADYEKFIHSMIDELLPELEGVKSLHVSFLKDSFDKDKSVFYPKFEHLNADIELGKFTRDKIGGVIVVDKDHEILYDLSLKAVLDSSVDDIGMIIYEEFDRQVNYES